MNILCVVGVKNGHLNALYDFACINFVVKEKGGDTSLRVAINDGPVDRGGTTVLGEQGGMEIERAETGHGPHNFREHSEGDNNL